MTSDGAEETSRQRQTETATETDTEAEADREYLDRPVAATNAFTS